MRVGDLLQFENLGTAETSDDESFHAESLTVLWRDGRPVQPGGNARLSISRVDRILAIDEAINVAINLAGAARKAVSETAASASIMMIEFPIPVA